MADSIRRPDQSPAADGSNSTRQWSYCAAGSPPSPTLPEATRASTRIIPHEPPMYAQGITKAPSSYPHAQLRRTQIGVGLVVELREDLPMAGIRIIWIIRLGNVNTPRMPPLGACTPQETKRSHSPKHMSMRFLNLPGSVWCETRGGNGYTCMNMAMSGPSCLYLAGRRGYASARPDCRGAGTRPAAA